MKLNFDLNKNKDIKHTIVVTCPYESETILAINKFIKEGFIDVIFVGEKDLIETAIKKSSVQVDKYSLIEALNDEDAAIKTMELLSQNNADILMKGLIETSLLLKTLLKREYNLRTDRILSHVCISANYDDLSNCYLISDAAINIKPDINQKKQIIENAVTFANGLGIETPKVALLCAKDKPYEKMPSTMDAQQLHEMYLNKEIINCIVSGPMQIDIALDKVSAQIKKTKDPVAGEADILICPDIDSANIFTKSLCYLANRTFIGVVIGAKIPIILTSRSSKEIDQALSIQVCLKYIQNQK